MTMKIEVTIPEDEIRSDTASQYLARAMSAIGFGRDVVDLSNNPLRRQLERLAAENERIVASRGVMIDPAREDAAETELANAAAGRLTALADMPPAATTEPEAPKRERGKPSPGRARRTKEEIAEDEAAEAREAQIAARRADDEQHSRVIAAGRAAVAAEDAKANISTGEERVDPTSPEDAAQDAADEAAEAQGAQAPELTHDDVRAALKKYLDAYGTPAAMEDGPKVLTLVFGKPTPKVSDVPADQESLSRAIAGIEEMLTKNPYKREAQL